MSLPPFSNAPGAVVVGLCAHGLAITRALACAGVTVHSLEANRALPGYATRYARVTHAPDINGTGLIDALLALAGSFDPEVKPVLFLTNDNMVRTVGQQWVRLQEHYRLSWAECRERLLPLLDKASLEAHCARLGLPYPGSRLLENAEQVAGLGAGELDFPLIVKPTRPLSGFKVRLIHSASELSGLADRYAHALPFLLQQWVPGGDERLFFTAFYLDRGRILAAYEGQKLGSNPPAMGQTSIARSQPNAAAREIAERFFAPLALSGPVSLEVKLDADGRPWIIEPTLGRTDYWLDCCVANDVNLPVMEYAHMSGQPTPPAPVQRDAAIWFDTERVPLSYLRFRLRTGKPAGSDWKPRFPYCGHDDSAPFRRGMWRLCAHTAERVRRRLARMFGSSQAER